MSYFCKELLKTQRRSIGRFDARYQGIESSPPAASPSFDPSLAGVRAPYTSTFNNYVRTELGYKTDVPYFILGEGVGPWDWQKQMGYPTTTDELKDALTKNPHMMVLIASGYYDLATPYRAVEHTLAAHGIGPELAQEHHDRKVRGRPHDVRPRPVAPQTEARRCRLDRSGDEEVIDR